MIWPRWCRKTIRVCMLLGARIAARWATYWSSRADRVRLEEEIRISVAKAEADLAAYAAWTQGHCFHQRCHVNGAVSTCLDCGNSYEEPWGAVGEQPPPLPPPTPKDAP